MSDRKEVGEKRNGVISLAASSPPSNLSREEEREERVSSGGPVEALVQSEQ